jgi:ubiquinone/menaquinone biosynthesis C-methylase UbiE
MKETLSPTTPWVEESLFGVWFLGTHTWLRSVLKRALNDLVPLIPNKKVSYPTILDIGFGHGQSLWLLEEYFQPTRLIGLDIDPRAQTRATNNIKKCKCNVEILQSDAAFIALPDASVDMIFCHQSFHHLVNQDRAIKEFLRVLKPGGVLLFAESCRRYIHSFIIRLLFRHPMHVQKSDLEYIQLITDSGFSVKPESISRPFLWWSLPDLGLLSYFGLKSKELPGKREETMVNLVACKPEPTIQN